MYESTPQHIIDEEAQPGPVAAWMDSDSSSDSSSDSDSDASSGSNTTAKRVKRLITGRRRRKSSAGSKETDIVGSPSNGPSSLNPDGRLSIEDPEDGDDEAPAPRVSRQGSFASHIMTRKERKRERKAEKKAKKQRKKERKQERKLARTNVEGVAASETQLDEKDREPAEENSISPVRYDFAVPTQEQTPEVAQRRGIRLRGITQTMVPRIPSNVFSSAATSAAPSPGPVPRVRYGIRRTNSLPDRLNNPQSAGAAGAAFTTLQPVRIASAAAAATRTGEEDDEKNISRTTAVFLLLISTGLVAVCAEFMVDSINAVVESGSSISEAFIGLIILPIVGNAAEHVTAVTVASKNKMDLAIGVAVGSSIQIGM